jgi:hypothetical protein
VAYAISMYMCRRETTSRIRTHLAAISSERTDGTVYPVQGKKLALETEIQDLFATQCTWKRMARVRNGEKLDE